MALPPPSRGCVHPHTRIGRDARLTAAKKDAPS
jgi:hypothetical protein